MMTPAFVVPINAEYVLPLLLSKEYIIAPAQQGAVFVLNFKGELQTTIEAGKLWGAASHEEVLATANEDGAVRLWHLSTGDNIRDLLGHTGPVKRVMFQSSSLLASASSDHTVRLWDPTAGTLMRTLVGHSDEVWQLEFYGRWLLSGSADSTARLWGVESGACLHVLRGHMSSVVTSHFSQDGERLATGALKGEIRIWSTQTGDCIAAIQAHTKMATKLLTLDNNLLSIGADGTLHTVHWDNGSDATPALTPHSNAIRGLVSHENVVVTGSTDGTIKIWKRGNYDVPAYQLIEPAYVVWQLDSVGDKLVAAYVKSETEKVVIAAWDLGALQAP